MALAVMVIAALAWCSWLAWDAVQECRKIDAGRADLSVGRGRDGARPSRLADCVEVR